MTEMPLQEYGQDSNITLYLSKVILNLILKINFESRNNMFFGSSGMHSISKRSHFCVETTRLDITESHKHAKTKKLFLGNWSLY